MLPFADWPFEQLPDLLCKMGVVVYRKALYFALGLGLLVWGLRVWVGRPKSSFDRLAIIAGATFVGYNLFLLLIFVAHFNGHPQSYWRFNTHIGFLIFATTVYGLGLAYHRHGERLKPGIVAGLKNGVQGVRKDVGKMYSLSRVSRCWLNTKGRSLENLESPAITRG